MQPHPRAKLGPAGRLALTDANANGMTQKAAAAAFCVAPATAHRWWHRRRAATEHELRSGNRALPHWLAYYNERRPHSSIGGLPPISRVHNVRGQDS
jgi:transposase InsO family protein